ncbi:MAG: ATP-binding cassette domain-containing protein, partial [bacterium]
MPEIILSTKKLTKTFGEFRALENLSVEIQAGKITGLIGPNGAGKSTLFHTLTGILQPTEGQVFLKSQEITNSRTNQLFKMGLAFTFQLPRP